MVTIVGMSSCAALAVFTRSPAAYDALKDFKLLQLPSRRTLKDYTLGQGIHNNLMKATVSKVVVNR